MTPEITNGNNFFMTIKWIRVTNIGLGIISNNGMVYWKSGMGRIW